MAQINCTDTYSIDDLISAWKAGWENLAILVRSFNLGYENDFCESPNSDPDTCTYNRQLAPELLFIRLALREILEYHIIGRQPWWSGELSHMTDSILQAAYCKLKPINSKICTHMCPCDSIAGSCLIIKYWDSIGKKITKEEQIRMQITFVKTLIETPTINDAFVIHSRPKDRERITSYWSFVVDKKRLRYNKEYADFRESPFFSFDALLSKKITESAHKMLRWIVNVADNPKLIPEAFYSIIWLSIQPKIKRMKEIQCKINTEVPLNLSDIDFLNEIMLHKSSPQIKYPIKEGASENHICMADVSVEYTYSNVSYTEYTCEHIAEALLLQPAYKLALDLKAKFTKPRFIAKCRAPSCGKEFYTGRGNATACPPKSNKHKKSACSLEWKRFKEYLLKIGNSPISDWDDSTLKKQFIDYDNS